VSEHDEHLIVRTAANPTYRWGNFLLITAPPARRGDPERWIDRFRRAFPRARHVAIGLDAPAPDARTCERFVAAGLSGEENAVLVCETPRERVRAPAHTDFRALRDDDDWARATNLRASVDETSASGYREFLERQMRAVRAACERGHGAWFGAFRDGEMLAGLGVFDAGDALARFQAVDTHPAHRRQGLASTLLVRAGEHARTQLRARQLVIAADPHYFAIDIYRALGFRERERQLQFERVHPQPGA